MWGCLRMNTHKHLPLNIDIEKLLTMCDGTKQIDEQKRADYIARKAKVNARRRERYAANLEQRRAKMRQHYAEHRDEIREYQRKRYAANTENPEYAARLLEYSRKYRAEHRDEINAMKRAWRARKRAEKLSQQQTENKDI